MRSGRTLCIMLSDNTVTCSWRYAVDRRGVKNNRNKTEYMCVKERELGGAVNMQGVEAMKVDV